MARGAGIETLVSERQRLIGRLEQQREQLEVLRSVTEALEEQIASDEGMLADIESVLGKAPQLRLDEANLRLRGRRLEEVAIELLRRERGAEAEVHYKEWFELLRSEGHLVAGKNPIYNFLTQLNRSTAVERVGRRTGIYRLNEVA